MANLGILAGLLCLSCIYCVKLEQKYLWQELEFAWPSESAREEAVTSGRYKVDHNLPLGLDIWNDKLFITVPRCVYSCFSFSINIYIFLMQIEDKMTSMNKYYRRRRFFRQRVFFYSCCLFVMYSKI